MTKIFGDSEPGRWLAEHVGYQGDDCLTWPFGGSNGYGMVNVGRKRLYAHRLMCEAIHGPSPPRHEAAHSCGRGHLGCVNPRHLSWKTKSENQHDRRAHGTRNAWGGRGKLTDAQAEQIRALRGCKPQREIAAMFGVSRANVSLIMTGNLHANKTRRLGYSQRPSGLWGARIRVSRKNIWLGEYKTPELARAAYLAADARARAGLRVDRADIRDEIAGGSQR